MARWLKMTLAAAVFLLLAATPLAREFDTGSIEGLIMNNRGPVAHAMVEARNVMSGATFCVESDKDGHYKVAELRAGRYSLWVNAAGHDSIWIPQILVERGATVHKDVFLARAPSRITE